MFTNDQQLLILTVVCRLQAPPPTKRCGSSIVDREALQDQPHLTFAATCLQSRMAVSTYLPEKYFSVDVECVATSRRHDERSVALVAVVDKDEKVLLKAKVKQDNPVFSYLTPLTGLRPGDLDNGEQLDDVIRQVKALFGPDVVLVGQGIPSDIKWLKLEEKRDFKSSVDLGKLFKTYNPRYDNYSYFSLSHEANTLIRSGK